MTSNLNYRRVLPCQLALTILACACLAGPAMAGWERQWIDRFDGSVLDLSNWTPQIQANYNNEIQCYTDDDSSSIRNYDLSGGTLKIIARRDSIDCPGLGGAHRSWTSGRINGKDKREFLYGRIEARIRFLNLEAGTWPAFWMLENRIAEDPLKGDNDFVNWPNPGAGEIDVWEWFSNNPNSYITNFFNTGGCGSEVRYTYPGGSGDVLQWHDYAIEWDADAISFHVDDTLVATHDISACAQYKEPMFVLLNLAMGGNLGGLVDPALNLATLEVDYVAHCTATADNSENRCNEATPAAATSKPDDLVIFDDFERLDWPAWDCCGGSTPVVVVDVDLNFAEAMQFNINGSTVVGFTARAPDAVGGMPYNALGIIDSAALEFDLKLTTSPGVTDWKLKVESQDAASSVEVSLASSREGHPEPLLNQWQHYSFALSDLVALGLDASAIDLVLVFPEWGTGDDAVYRIDNVKIREDVSRFAPVIESSPLLSVAVNTPYHYTLVATDADDDLLTFSAPVKPAWLSFDEATGQLFGIPTTDEVGSHDITLEVSDGSTIRAQSFSIEVTGNDTPPQVTSSMESAARVDEDYSYVLIAEDADGDSVTLSLVSGPGWLSFDVANGILSGRPDSNYQGDNQVIFAISDGSNTVQFTLTILVESATSSGNTANSSSATAEDESAGGSSGGGSFDLLLLLLLTSCVLRGSRATCRFAAGAA